MKYILSLLLGLVLFTSCSKDELICGTVTGGDYDYVNNMHYLRVDGKRIWVDAKTWQSIPVGSYECFEDW